MEVNSFKKVAHLVTVGTVMLAIPQIVPAAGPDPAKPYITSIGYSGTGCPQGSVGQSFSNDRLMFTLIFDNFGASTGPGVLVTETKKNCIVNLTLQLPRGSSTWVQTSLVRGYVQLPAGQTAALTSITTLANPAGEGRDGEDPEDGSGVSRRTSRTDFKGAISKDYTAAEGHAYQVQTGCGREQPSTRTLSLNYTLQVSPGPTVAQATVDSLDGMMVVQAVKSCKADD